MKAGVLLGWILLVPGIVRGGEIRLTEIAAASGLDFIHWNGMVGRLDFPEMTGQGAALVDYDGDGDLDVYLVQGTRLAPGDTDADALRPHAMDGPPRDRLYRNDPGPGGAPRFVDVTERAGLRALGYGMGVAVGDFENDGDVDLYVTNYGPNQLWLNQGDGTFRDATATAGAGVDDPNWSSSAAVADLDGDGLLDLYVTNYVRYRIEDAVRCYATSSRLDYCGPSSFPGERDRVLRGLGDGRFEDVTARWLEGDTSGPGLGVLVADLDGDRKLDLYVANDGAANKLWLRRDREGGEVAFQDEALFSGVAVNRSGRPEASMGIDAEDLDDDGDLDLILMHLMGETNTLYINEGDGLFSDHSSESGLGAPSFDLTSFGTGFVDVDADGRLDLIVANGAVKILEAQAREGSILPLAQPNQLYRNLGGGRFSEATAEVGEALTRSEVSRGTALGDVDNDGDEDILITNNNGPVRLLRNDAAAAHWLGLRAVTGAALGRRDALGALLRVRGPGGVERLRRARTEGSYLSAHDPRRVVALPETASGVTVRIDWLDGRKTTWRNLPLDVYLTLPASP